MAKSKKSLLLSWIKFRGKASSAEIENQAYILFGMLPSNARRRCREWAQGEDEEINILRRYVIPGSALVHYEYIRDPKPKTKPESKSEIFTKQETLSLGA